ncbi:hypothetical protein ILUMI_01902, partial [Ignelater luminosus]
MKPATEQMASIIKETLPKPVLCDTQITFDINLPSTSSTNIIYHQETSSNTNDEDNKFGFLNESIKKGILGKVELSKKELSPKKNIMYKIYRNMCTKVSKLKKALENEKSQLKILRQLYDEGRFEIMHNELNDVTKNFINSQLRNVNKTNGKCWTTEDKAFALSLYKRSPRLYRYLENQFELPSIRTLKTVLSKIPFASGLNPAILNYLKTQVSQMTELEKFVTIAFDEISLAKGFYYEGNKQTICGFEDLGHLDKTSRPANHALVIMLRGIKRSFKQVLGYYFTSSVISTIHLKHIITNTIKELQNIGLKVIATICDQGTTNQAALSALCNETNKNGGGYDFIINNQTRRRSLRFTMESVTKAKDNKGYMMPCSPLTKQEAISSSECTQEFSKDQHGDAELIMEELT